MDEFATILILSSFLFFAVFVDDAMEVHGIFCFVLLYSSLFFSFFLFVCCTQELYLDCIQSRDDSAISALPPF